MNSNNCTTNFIFQILIFDHTYDGESLKKQRLLKNGLWLVTLHININRLDKWLRSSEQKATAEVVPGWKDPNGSGLVLNATI